MGPAHLHLDERAAGLLWERLERSCTSLMAGVGDRFELGAQLRGTRSSRGVIRRRHTRRRSGRSAAAGSRRPGCR
eukprot:4638289-Prymnesium_polylepis.1